MSKLVFHPINIRCNKKGDPVGLFLEEKLILVSHLLECWYDTGCWWEGESEKIFYRIHCQDSGIYEIFKDLSTGKWFLYKIYD